MTMLENIMLAIVAVPVGIGLLVAGLFGLWLIGTAIYYLVCYGRLP
jgi:hypothetical protein